MIEQTKQIMNEIQWYGALKVIDKRISEASTYGWGHIEFLSALLTDEKIYRDIRKTQRRIKAAQFRTTATLERIDFTAGRNLSKTLVRDLMSLSFLKSAQNIFIEGPTGSGKTFLATALGEYVCRSGYTCIFNGITVLMERLMMSRTDGSYLKYREKLCKCDLLIIDDLGLKKIPQEIAVDLHDILEERQERSTIVTTQLPLKNWKEIIEDPLALDTIVDKLQNGTLNIDLQCEISMRKIAKKKNPVDTQSVPEEITNL